MEVTLRSERWIRGQAIEVFIRLYVVKTIEYTYSLMVSE